MNGIMPRLLTLSLCAGLGLYMGRGPWLLAEGERAKTAALAADAARAEARRVELTVRDAELRSPVGREALARSRGFMMPGEVSAPPVR